MNKKGILAVQFNWILVLIIGGLILLLFIAIVQKQRQVSEEEIAGTIQTDLQAILTSSQVSTGTASIVEMPNKEIKFDCEGGMPGFKLGSQTPTRFPYAFAPDLIKSDRSAISIYAYDWSVPYRVTNFLYVTSPDIKYTLVEDLNNQDLLDSLEGLLPPRYISKDGQQKLFMNFANINYTNPLVLTDTNNYKVRIIYLTGSTTGQTINIAEGLKNTKNKDISALAITLSQCDTSDPLDCYGNLIFYNYNGTGWSGTQSSFVGKAAILAAIFSENKALYECGMNNSLKRLESISEVYKIKAENLSSSLCNTLYTNAALNALALSQVTEISDSQIIYENATSLKETNEDLLEASCPPLY